MDKVCGSPGVEEAGIGNSDPGVGEAGPGGWGDGSREQGVVGARELKGRKREKGEREPG